MSEQKTPTAPEPTATQVLRELVALQREANEKMSAEAERVIKGVTPPRKERRIPGLGVNGSKMTLVVVEDPAHPEGLVVSFEGYQYPEGIFKHAQEGGLLPDGMQISRDGKSDLMCAQLGDPNKIGAHALNPWYLEWLRTTFTKADHDMMIGRGMRAQFCDPNGPGLKAKWEAPAKAAA